MPIKRVQVSSIDQNSINTDVTKIYKNPFRGTGKNYLFALNRQKVSKLCWVTGSTLNGTISLNFRPTFDKNVQFL